MREESEKLFLVVAAYFRCKRPEAEDALGMMMWCNLASYFDGAFPSGGQEVSLMHELR